MKKRTPRKVLVIDDEPDLRQFSAWVLEAEGYHVLQAVDVNEGMEMARQEHPDLILLDIRLPDRYGWTVLTEIKNTPSLSDMPVVIFTASADITYKERAMNMGAADYLVKPISAATLRECVARTLKNVSTKSKLAF